MKITTIGIIVMIVIVSILGILAYQVFQNDVRAKEINSDEGRYKIDISGKVHYGVAGVGGWYIDTFSYSVSRMNSQDLSIWPSFPAFFETGNIKVICKITSPTGVTLSESLDLGQFSWTGGGEKVFFITIDMLHPNISPYTLIVTVEESGKGQVATKSVSGIQVHN